MRESYEDYDLSYDMSTCPSRTPKEDKKIGPDTPFNSYQFEVKSEIP